MKTWIALSLAALTATAAETFDTVIANGRVMDPATELDAIRHIGISGGTIKSISKTPLKGKSIIDAKGPRRRTRICRPPPTRPKPGGLSVQGDGRRDDRARVGSRHGGC